MFRLPVSDVTVEVRPPSGADDLFVREATQDVLTLALELVGRLASVQSPTTLLVHDFEALLLYLHSLVFGDPINATAVCTCRAPVDISFRASEYLAQRAPRTPRNVSVTRQPGWFQIDDVHPLEFRLPTIGDRIEVRSESDPVAALAALCLRSQRRTARVERAMETLAPPLSDVVEGCCPHCQNTIRLLFDVPSFVLHELKTQAVFLYEDVHLLAQHYHWSEQHILALPARRRQQYAELVRSERRSN